MHITRIHDDRRVKLSDLFLRADLRAEADRVLAQRSIIGVFSYFLFWLIIYYASELEQANDALLEFMGFMLAAAGAGRLYLALNFSALYASNARLWRWLFTTGTLISAAIWGGVGALAMDFDGLGTTSVLVMLPSAGIAAGGIVSLAPAPRLGSIFSFVLLLPATTVALLSGHAPEIGVAVLFLTFLVFMNVLWWQLRTEYWRALHGRSELVRAKEAAEAATLAKGQFIASVSHELRTPLTSVIGALGMVVEYPPEDMPAEAMVLIDMAYRNGRQLSTLVNDILDFEKLDAHQMEFHYRPTELLTFLTRVLELNGIYAEQHHVSFVLEPPAPGLAVMGDENRLMQVMANLLSNAVKHSPAGEKVLISVKDNAGMVRISVTDHGAGVPESFRPQIFEKFAQAENSTTRKAKGTGLGLAISKAIVEQMGGRIGYDSVAGQGATFYFELPMAETAPDTGRAKV
ncbi:MAG TPA: HAMP domain-containing sensor histidine kinase [Gallionellaceae bacterium]